VKLDGLRDRRRIRLERRMKHYVSLIETSWGTVRVLKLVVINYLR
jgi:hypothetical protein